MRNSASSFSFLEKPRITRMTRITSLPRKPENKLKTYFSLILTIFTEYAGTSNSMSEG